MTANLEALRARLEELSDLDSAGSLLEWDHQTMMPISVVRPVRTRWRH